MKMRTGLQKETYQQLQANEPYDTENRVRTNLGGVSLQDRRQAARASAGSSGWDRRSPHGSGQQPSGPSGTGGQQHVAGRSARLAASWAAPTGRIRWSTTGDAQRCAALPGRTSSSSSSSRPSGSIGAWWHRKTATTGRKVGGSGWPCCSTPGSAPPMPPGALEANPRWSPNGPCCRRPSKGRRAPI